MDPERLVQCPYDKHHQIRACRFPYHLVKCRKNNQKIANQLVTCSYNARHRVPMKELNLHLASCENKTSLEASNVDTNPHMGVKTTTTWQCPSPQEDWEADADESPAPPFAFGISCSDLKSEKLRLF